MTGEDVVKQVADRVREAIDVAEKRAEEIVRAAEKEAQRIRSEAEAAATRLRGEAESEAQRRLEEVRGALDELQGKLGGVRAEVDPGPVTVPEPEPPATPEPTPDPTPEPVPQPVPEPGPEPVPEPSPPPGEADPPSPEPTDTAGDGADAAVRLVAMKLVLEGTPRDEARRRLAADYDVADLDSLLDEVYAKAGK
jgi:outer membrane biosynthesis protein TonB